MKHSAILFDQIEWQSPQPGVRFKTVRDGSRQLRLVEFSENFVEVEACAKAHVGFVLSGILEVDFSGHVVRFPEGSALAIPSGPAHAHKARAVTPTARLFLVESIPDQESAVSMEAMNSVTDLPFNRFLGIEIATEPGHVLRLPSGAQYRNHLGTVHASAQLALAEASSGEFLLHALGSTLGFVPVVRRLETKFRKPANGALTSTAVAPLKAIEQLRADLAAKGRATISVAIELYDESAAHTLSAVVEWFITRTNP